MPKTLTGLAALAAADARVQHIRQTIGERRRQDAILAAERDAATVHLRQTLAAAAMGEASEATVTAAHHRIDTNTADIAAYNAMMNGLRASLSEAENACTGVLRDESDAIAGELAPQGRALNTRRAKAEHELAAIDHDLQPLSALWRRLETATSHGRRIYREDTQTGLVRLGADGRPDLLGAEPVTGRIAAAG